MKVRNIREYTGSMTLTEKNAEGETTTATERTGAVIREEEPAWVTVSRSESVQVSEYRWTKAEVTVKLPVAPDNVQQGITDAAQLAEDSVTAIVHRLCPPQDSTPQFDVLDQLG